MSVLTDRLRAVCHGMPPGSSVSLPVSWILETLETDEGEGVATPRLLTLEEVAETVSRAVSTVRTWCNSGELPGAFRLNGRTWRVPERALEEYLRAQASPSSDTPEPPAGSERPVDLGAWREERKAS